MKDHRFDVITKDVLKVICVRSKRCSCSVEVDIVQTLYGRKEEPLKNTYGIDDITIDFCIKHESLNFHEKAMRQRIMDIINESGPSSLKTWRERAVDVFVGHLDRLDAVKETTEFAKTMGDLNEL